MNTTLNKPFYITTAIDYVNARPHVGHATEKILADVIARYHRDILGDETYFLTGSDENSLKNVQAAEKVGQPTQAFIDEQTHFFQELASSLQLSFDQFIRTTEARHFAGAQKMWKAFDSSDVYKRAYRGLYCVGCEEFKGEKDLIDGKCADHQKEPEVVDEENYFFRLSAYQEKLRELISNDKLRVFPEYRKNEVLAFIDSGLEDFSISRSVMRAKNWGVSVPGDAEQIMYVWVDALSNYITALDYATEGALYQKLWSGDGERVHVIGKGILRFHAIYWPAMLLSAGLPLPTQIYAHEYLTIGGQKMSKTLGNVIAPSELVERYGIDGARYLLISALPYTKDGDLSWEKMTEKYHADLANGLGNLVSRLIKLSEKLETSFEVSVTEKIYPSELQTLFAEYRLCEALEWILDRTRVLDRRIAETKPWILVKTDGKEFEVVMREFLEELAFIAYCLRPFLSETSEKIERALKERQTEVLFRRVV
jgi:methionyl-tRNA synthetase